MCTHPENLAKWFSVDVYPGQVCRLELGGGTHLVLGRQRQADLCECKRPAWSTELVLGWPRLPEKPFLGEKKIQAEGNQE